MSSERHDFDQGGIPLDAALTPPVFEAPRTPPFHAPRMPEQLTTVRSALDDLARRIADLEQDLLEFDAEG
jgi:hypothetical protein